MDLTFAQSFSLIALNNEDSHRMTNSKKVSLRCVTAATMLELYLNQSTDKSILDISFSELQGSNLGDYQNKIYQILSEKVNPQETPLIEALVKVMKLFSKQLKEIENIIEENLSHMMREIPALLNLDFEYVTAGITMKEYRCSSTIYAKIIEGFRAEVLEDGPMSDETILMLWLLRESGNMYDVFSNTEMTRVGERMEWISKESELAQTIYPLTIHKTLETGIKRFLSFKKDVMTTQTGAGITFIFPQIERSEAAFIETEKYFANEEERLQDLQERLEGSGHHFNILKKGKVPLVKIDNQLYQAIPSAKNLNRVVIHGIRLRKHPQSVS